jgi:hypothetical protein
VDEIGGIAVEYKASTLNRTDEMIIKQRVWWGECEIVVYVDGAPYPQPYPNNVYPLPEVNDSSRVMTIYNLRDGAPHTIQLYLMYVPEYAVLQIVTTNLFMATHGAGCSTGADCSNQGVCYRGYCVCYDGFVGKDCSVEGEFVMPSVLCQDIYR